jgi:ABC-type sugar transport system permease subunit
VIASAMLWTWLYERDFGLVNQVLGATGFYRAVQAAAVGVWTTGAWRVLAR